MRHSIALAVLAFGAASFVGGTSYADTQSCGPGGEPQQPPVTSPGDGGTPGGDPSEVPPPDGSPNGALLNHFQCYGLRQCTPIGRPIVNLIDRYGSAQGEICKTRSLCAPADKNGEDPGAENDTGYLTAYGIRRTGNFDDINGQTVTNQFGTVTVDLIARRTLMVPTTIGGGSPDGAFPNDGSPGGAILPHFTCYDVRKSPGSVWEGPGEVDIVTPYETKTLILRKPWRLCVPADKNGEDPGAENGEEDLLCYRTKCPAGSVGRRPVSFTNQFGDQEAQLNQRGEFCVPSRRGGGGTTTTTTSPTTSTSVSSTSTPTSSTTSTTSSPDGAFVE